ncbi:hypothetical protein [Desulfoscipio geothermicus]|uniref:DUF3800 domain-containing protein n=1 Tax=Desulfoscipio geothermicus DSM 3669 TaxID=1121426 RepID=A0A1I6DXD8_9FIRM|nr:hypothetical protein [Desulfoscipio geothermicus]SFR10169.1 hypothetical protein SAMN05660706_12052 [Desulfoscipio geothermicus DSM 3669]
MQREQSIKVFFDESGKGSEKPNLMAGLVIPAIIYNSPDLESYSQQLRDNKLKLHWKSYAGDAKKREDITGVIEIFNKYCGMTKLNVINYDYSVLTGRKEFDSKTVERMIYTKFPERIIYGLLRGYGKNVYIKTDIFIEHSSEYEVLRLHDVVKEQLNTQSLYRGEHYIVENSKLVPKGVEIGVELTDLLIGIIRTIIKNQPDDKSKSVNSKNNLVIQLLKNKIFHSFIENIRYFEWTSSKELMEINFKDYLQLFLSNHYEKWVANT